MNIIFFGSPSYSCKVLESLLANKHVVQTIVTQNFKNNRRTKTPVGLLGESKNINTLYPADLSDKKFIEILKSQNDCLFSRITGSGSACIGVFSNMKAAILTQKLIKIKFPKYWCVVSKTM